MASPAKFRCSNPAFHLQKRYPQTFSFHPFSVELAKSTPVRYPVIRASSSSNPKPSILKTTCITLTAAAALLSASFYLVSRPPATTTPVAISAEEGTKKDVEALLSLTKIKFESNEHGEAIEILNRMIEIDPEELEWSLMKARVLAYCLDSKSAIEAFEEILVKDPIRVEAYHHLVESCASRSRLAELEKRISEAIGRCIEEKKTKEVRDLRLLIAQIRVFEGNLLEALGICEELAMDDPENPCIYLFQGFVHSLMKQDDEAAKQFNHCARLLPEDHPLRENASNTKVLEWRFIVAYDSVLCYVYTFTKIMIGFLFSSIHRITRA